MCIDALLLALRVAHDDHRTWFSPTALGNCACASSALQGLVRSLAPRFAPVVDGAAGELGAAVVVGRVCLFASGCEDAKAACGAVADRLRAGAFVGELSITMSYEAARSLWVEYVTDAIPLCPDRPAWVSLLAIFRVLWCLGDLRNTAARLRDPPTARPPAGSLRRLDLSGTPFVPVPLLLPLSSGCGSPSQ